MTKDECAKPIWANLFFVDQNDRTVWNGSVGFHGRPRVGEFIERIDDDICGLVTSIKWATMTGGTFKATVWVRTIG